MHPTSGRQFQAWTSGDVPPLEEVRDDVWALGVAIPQGPLPYSLCYLLRDAEGGVHVVDPGTDTDGNWTSLLASLADIDASLAEVRSVLLTHMHSDHSGLAGRIRRSCEADLRLLDHEQGAIDRLSDAATTPSALALLLDAWCVPQDARSRFPPSIPSPAVPVAASSTYQDGAVLNVPGFELTAIWTPGHTPGSVGLHDRKRSILFTGDHVLPMMFSGLGLGGPTASNSLSDYLTGLERLRPAHDDEVLPGHGYRFRGLAQRIEELAEHHLRRSRKVRAELGEDDSLSTWELASRLSWTAGWENLHGTHLVSALRQTDMHRDYVADSSDDPAGGEDPRLHPGR